MRFSRPPKGEINANTTEGTQKHKGRLDTATTPPAEASGVSGAILDFLGSTVGDFCGASTSDGDL